MWKRSPQHQIGVSTAKEILTDNRSLLQIPLTTISRPYLRWHHGPSEATLPEVRRDGVVNQTVLGVAVATVGHGSQTTDPSLALVGVMQTPVKNGTGVQHIQTRIDYRLRSVDAQPPSVWKPFRSGSPR